MSSKIRVDRDLLVEFLRAYPFQPATAWWRAVEIGHLLAHAPQPVGQCLDVGCGDGLLTEILLRHWPRSDARWIGADPDPAETALAEKRGLYERVITAPGNSVDLSSGSCDYALSNSVLEHIPEVRPVLAETARVLKPGAPFVFSVPSAQFHDCLRGPGILRRRLLGESREDYLRSIDQRVAHRYYWSEPEWDVALRAAGFAEIRYSSYFSPSEVAVWERTSNATGGLLHEILGKRPPIEIQRSLGMRSAARMPTALARPLAAFLSATERNGMTSPYGGLLVVASRAK